MFAAASEAAIRSAAEGVERAPSGEAGWVASVDPGAEPGSSGWSGGKFGSIGAREAAAMRRGAASKEADSAAGGWRGISGADAGAGAIAADAAGADLSKSGSRSTGPALVALLAASAFGVSVLAGTGAGRSASWRPLSIIASRSTTCSTAP